MKGSLAGLELLIPRVHKFVIFCGDELRQQTRWYISLAPSTGDASLGRHRRFVSGDYRSRALKVTPRWSAFASRGQLRSRPNCGNGANHHFLTIIVSHHSAEAAWCLGRSELVLTLSGALHGLICWITMLCRGSIPPARRTYSGHL